MEFCISTCAPLLSCFVIGYHWEKSGSIFYTTLTSGIYMHLEDPPESSLLQVGQSQLSPLLVWRMLQGLNHPGGPSLDSLRVCLILGSPEPDWSRCASLKLSRGEGSPPLTCWQLFFHCSPDSVDLVCYKGALEAHGQLDVHKESQVFLCFFCFLSARWLPVRAPEQQGFASSFVEQRRLVLAHFSRLSTSLWVAAHPSGLSATTPNTVSSLSLLKVDSLLSPIIFPLQRIESLGWSV